MQSVPLTTERFDRGRQWIAACASIAFITSACSRGPGGVHEIDSEKIVVVNEAPEWDAPVEQRFGFRVPDSSRSVGAAPPPMMTAWDLPDGWKEVPVNSQFRAASFLAGGDPNGDCSLTLLEGTAGGLGPNVNRWLGQMSLPAMSAEDIDALPTAEFFGMDAKLLDVESGDRRMVGLLAIDPSGSRFLKMVGPKSVIDPEVEAFFELARSFREVEDEHAGHDHAKNPHTEDEPSNDAGLAFDTPEGWTRGPDRSPRILTMLVGEAECYLSALGGDGGGVAENVNRWRRQMGDYVLSQEEIDGLRTIPILGYASPIMDAAGTYRGMGGEEIEDALLLGTVTSMGEMTLFIKMIGPRETVDAERDAFESFCKSLELRR